MFAKFGLIFSCAIVYVQTRSRNDLSSEGTFDNSCDFDDTQKYYDSKDLLRCMNFLATYLKTREIDRSTKNEYNSRLHSGQDSPWTDLIVSLFNGISKPGYQIPQFSDTVSSQYQSSQYPTTVGGFFGTSGILNINLFEALHSISRYDDLKCVPRILCEMASGVTPGELIYRRDTNMFSGNNILLRLLTNLNFAESSPILSFGKAALLGYTSKKNPRNCYQEYPQCPSNPDQLIHYLNNHNGGFFRFFNKFNHGNNPYARPYIVQNKQNKPSSIKFDFKIDSDRTGTGELKFDSITENDTRHYEPRIKNQLNRIIFPDDERSTIFVDISNRLPKTLLNLDDSDTDDDNDLHNGSNFFPQQTREEKYEESNLLYSSSQPFSESSFKTFVFPDD
ncbi:uncharacterized protein LOC118441039 isoform X1 [Vespa mandarinia]|uniref:uncharacterized protein LOC118441039 isoform X1 n=1 Tax=Vespa mandarinia TaxID=7446 RepID=UPI001618939D|nr:uncharacterized protein LOC118441039 isoform X1 [Vespa mandarinia]